MAVSIAQHLRRVTLKTVPIYIAIVILLVMAKPEIAWFLPGFVLAVAGEAIRIWAAGHLRKTKEVTTTGPYAYVKNPLYLGTLLILIGFCMMAVNWWLLAAGLAVFFVYYAPFKKKREGGRLLDKFGSDWTDYDQAVPDYIPRITPYPHRGAKAWSKEVFFENSEDGTLLSVALGILLLSLRFYF
jgi:protein-S-isoprenylcysteine O-methyltransferase Ste14